MELKIHRYKFVLGKTGMTHIFDDAFNHAILLPKREVRRILKNILGGRKATIKLNCSGTSGDGTKCKVGSTYVALPVGKKKVTGVIIGCQIIRLTKLNSLMEWAKS